MRTRNPNPARAHGVVTGHTSSLRTGGALATVRDDAGNEVDNVHTITFPGTLVAEGDTGEAVVNIGTTGGFVPDANIEATKDGGNPTFDFMSYPENVIKVGATYYCPYTTATNGDVKLATASNRDGPWAAGSTIFAEATVAWDVGGLLYAPEIVEDSGTFYLFYSLVQSGGTTSPYNAIGVATSSTITGTYTDYGAAILAPAASGLWDSRRVGEPSVINHGGQWIMAYMGEDSDLTYGESEKVGIATAPSATGPWTRHPSNPVIDFGTSGEWDDSLVADPSLVYADGYYWIMYAGGPDSTPSTALSQGLAYATDPTDTWTRYSANPILSPGSSGAWDDTYVWRGGLYVEDGAWGGVYAGFDGAATVKGGNFRLNIQSVVTDEPVRAEDVPIDDTGGYYTGTDVEAALQEAGAAIVALQAGGGGHWEVIVDGTAPPVAVTNEAEDDWLYGWVPD